MKFAFAFSFQSLNLVVSLEWELFSPVVAINIFKLFCAEAERVFMYLCPMIFKPHLEPS